MRVMGFGPLSSAKSDIHRRARIRIYDSDHLVHTVFSLFDRHGFHSARVIECHSLMECMPFEAGKPVHEGQQKYTAAQSKKIGQQIFPSIRIFEARAHSAYLTAQISAAHWLIR